MAFWDNFRDSLVPTKRFIFYQSVIDLEDGSKCKQIKNVIKVAVWILTGYKGLRLTIDIVKKKKQSSKVVTPNNRLCSPQRRGEQDVRPGAGYFFLRHPPHFPRTSHRSMGCVWRLPEGGARDVMSPSLRLWSLRLHPEVYVIWVSTNRCVGGV